MERLGGVSMGVGQRLHHMAQVTTAYQEDVDVICSDRYQTSEYNVAGNICAKSEVVRYL